MSVPALIANVPFQSTLSVRRATWNPVSSSSGYLFQSTLSVRRATRLVKAGRKTLDISIHALREESDHRRLAAGQSRQDFNPRSP